MKFLGRLLKQNSTLEIVDLNFNRIENDGAFYLSDALTTYNRTLQALVYKIFIPRHYGCDNTRVLKTAGMNETATKKWKNYSGCYLKHNSHI